MKYAYVIENNEFSDSINLGVFTNENDAIKCLKQLEIDFVKDIIKKYPQLHLQRHKDEYDGTTFFDLCTKSGKSGFLKYPTGDEYYYYKVPLNDFHATKKNALDWLKE